MQRNKTENTTTTRHGIDARVNVQIESTIAQKEMWKRFGASLLIYELFYYALSALPPFFYTLHVHMHSYKHTHITRARLYLRARAAARFFSLVSSVNWYLFSQQHTTHNFPVQYKNIAYVSAYCLICVFYANVSFVYFCPFFLFNGN